MPKINLKAPASTEVIGILKSLEKATVTQVTERSQFSNSTVNSIIKKLLDKRKVHVSGWHREKNIGWLRSFSWGEGHDLPKPKYLEPVDKTEPVRIKEVWPQCDVAANWMRNPI
jgi:hypothetical protein